MRPRGIDFFVYNVSDIARSADFYENTLGLTLRSREGPGWVEFAVGDTPTVPALRPDPEGAGAAVQGGAIAIAVDDVGQAVDKLRHHEVDILFGPGAQASCYTAGTSDSDGHLLLLHSR